MTDRAHEFREKIGIVNTGEVNLEGDQVGTKIVYESPPPSRPQAEQSLWERVSAEVENRLKSSLHNQVIINLGKKEQFQKVKRPWDYEVKVGTRLDEILPQDITIQQVFSSREVCGRLLILGKPGSGKTTTMLDLARELLERSQDPNESIPVLVNLSSWASKQQSIPEWLVEELHNKLFVLFNAATN